MKKQAGFTFIELIIVIVLIGILSAIALPRFIAATSDAQKSKVQAVYGAVRTAASLAKSRCELDIAGGAGPCTVAAGTATMDGLAIPMVNKYPAATNAGIQAAAGYGTTAAAALQDGITVAGAGPLTFTPVGATTPAQCVVSYTAAAAGAAPTITLVNTGC